MTESTRCSSRTTSAIYFSASAITCTPCPIYPVGFIGLLATLIVVSRSDLPKLLVFKIVGMQFAATVPESKESEAMDQTQLARMPSADLVRLQRAHKAEAMFVHGKKSPAIRSNSS